VLHGAVGSFVGVVVCDEMGDVARRCAANKELVVVSAGADSQKSSEPLAKMSRYKDAT
jgi:hypothetical protein